MTNIENEFWEGMYGIFPDIIKAITLLSSKSYVSITNLKTGVTWWSQGAMDYFHLDDNYIIRGKEKGNKMIHPDYIDIFKQGFKDRISGKKLDEPWEYRILDGSTYNRFTAMAKMLYDSYGKPFIIVIRYNNSGIADEIHNIYNKITDTLSNTIEVEGKRIPLKNSEVLFLIFLKKLVPSQKNYALNYHLMN